MQDVIRVRVGHRIAHAPKDPQMLDERCALGPASVDQRRPRPPANEAHDELQRAVARDAHHVNGDNSRVFEPAGDACLGDEVREHVGVVASHQLDRDLAPERRLHAAEHGAHSALADLLDQLDDLCGGCVRPGARARIHILERRQRARPTRRPVVGRAVRGADRDVECEGLRPRGQLRRHAQQCSFTRRTSEESRSVAASPRTRTCR